MRSHFSAEKITRIPANGPGDRIYAELRLSNIEDNESATKSRCMAVRRRTSLYAPNVIRTPRPSSSPPTGEKTHMRLHPGR